MFCKEPSANDYFSNSSIGCYVAESTVVIGASLSIASLGVCCLLRNGNGGTLSQYAGLMTLGGAALTLMGASLGVALAVDAKMRAFFES